MSTRPRLKAKSNLPPIVQAWNKLDKNQTEWPVLVMSFARELLKGRDMFTNAGKHDDRRFHDWLTALADQHPEFELSHQDRAAYINLAEHEEVAIEVLGKTDRRSVRLIWEEEVQPKVELFQREENPESVTDDDGTENDTEHSEKAAPEQRGPVEVDHKIAKVGEALEITISVPWKVVCLAHPDCAGPSNNASAIADAKRYLEGVMRKFLEDFGAKLQDDAVKAVERAATEKELRAKQEANLPEVSKQARAQLSELRAKMIRDRHADASDTS